MSRIEREDMLELTRRMTPERNCFHRIAGAYLDEEGFVDGTFNIHFLKLKPREQAANLAIAKAVLFAETNVKLKGYSFQKEQEGKDSFWQLLMALRACELKNDALMDVLYELVGKYYHAEGPYALYLFSGCYDIPRKGRDKAEQWESEEMYQFLVGALCPVHGDYEPEEPEWGFLFPAFENRSTNLHGIAIFNAGSGDSCRKLEEQMIFGNN